MKTEPYLFFEGGCDEAIAFYQAALDAEVTALFRYKDHPEPDRVHPSCAPEKVMHANLRIGDTMLMVSDGLCLGNAAFRGFATSLSVDNDADAERYFSALSEGGQVRMPLMPTFYSPSFGMVEDRFGVLWMVLSVTKPVPG
jgi:PhnB protein